MSLCAQLKSFLILTVHESHRQAVADRQPHESISYLASIAPLCNINLAHRASKVKALSEFKIFAHRDKHDRSLSADSNHYISSIPAFTNDMLDGLPGNSYTHPLFERYDYMPDREKTVNESNRLATAILRLPHRTRRDFSISPQSI